MTVYSRKTKSGVGWRYDFTIDGERFTPKKALASKRDAIAAEKARRKAIARGETDELEPGMSPAPKKAKPAAGAAVTLGDAIERYWLDVGQHLRSRRDVETRLATVARLIPATTPIADISNATISGAIATRRAEPTKRGGALSSGTVNRDTIDTLRPVLNHAALILHVRTATPIAWKKLRLKEAAEVVREFSDAEVERWGAELKGDEALFLAIALTYGPRLGELFFPPAAFRPDGSDGPELELGRYLGRGGVVRTSRKDGSLHTITLLDEDAIDLAPLVERAAAAGFSTIWLEERKTKGVVPISYYAMRARLVAAAERAGIQKGRIVHGMRHHAGTQIMRKTGSLVLAQTLLGHKQITTTRRYAHASKADLRAGLGKLSPRNRNRSTTAPIETPPRAR